MLKPNPPGLKFHRAFCPHRWKIVAFTKLSGNKFSHLRGQKTQLDFGP